MLACQVKGGGGVSTNLRIAAVNDEEEHEKEQQQQTRQKQTKQSDKQKKTKEAKKVHEEKIHQEKNRHILDMIIDEHPKHTVHY